MRLGWACLRNTLIYAHRPNYREERGRIGGPKRLMRGGNDPNACEAMCLRVAVGSQKTNSLIGLDVERRVTANAVEAPQEHQNVGRIGLSGLRQHSRARRP